MRRATSGFSLLEMMAVVAILGILMAVAFPSFTYLSSTTKVKSASTELYLALIRSRNEAVKRNRLVSITKNSSGWQAGWQIIADSNNDGSFTTADRLLLDSGEQKRVTITSGVDSVVFLASGRIQGSAVPSFVVTAAEKATMKRCVAADLTGKPYIRDPGSGSC